MNGLRTTVLKDALPRAPQIWCQSWHEVSLLHASRLYVLRFPGQNLWFLHNPITAGSSVPLSHSMKQHFFLAISEPTNLSKYSDENWSKPCFRNENFPCGRESGLQPSDVSGWWVLAYDTLFHFAPSKKPCTWSIVIHFCPDICSVLRSSKPKSHTHCQLHIPHYSQEYFILNFGLLRYYHISPNLI